DGTFNGSVASVARGGSCVPILSARRERIATSACQDAFPADPLAVPITEKADQRGLLGTVQRRESVMQPPFGVDARVRWEGIVDAGRPHIVLKGAEDNLLVGGRDLELLDEQVPQAQFATILVPMGGRGRQWRAGQQARRVIVPWRTCR